MARGVGTLEVWQFTLRDGVRMHSRSREETMSSKSKMKQELKEMKVVGDVSGAIDALFEKTRGRGM